jgi:hypothetical protein
MKLTFLAAIALGLAMAGSAAADQGTPTLPEVQASAQQSQAACVKKGEQPAVCACGVGLAYARLDPRVFIAAPRIDPLLDEKDAMKKIVGIAAIAQESGLSASDVQKAMEAVKANRQTIKDICKPLAVAGK